MLSIIKRALPLLMAAVLLAGCGQTGNVGNMAQDPAEDEAYVEQVDMEVVELEDEIVALAAAPAAQQKLLMPTASGKQVAKDKKNRAKIDYSNIKDGYVMCQFSAATTKRLKVIVQGPTTKYTYDLTKGEWETFPLSDGNGSYKVGIYENTSGTKYATVVTASLKVTLKDEFAPFLRPNQYVDYEDAPDTINQAEKLAGNETDPMKKVEKIYDYVVKNFTYDYDKAKTVKSGYLPELDKVLKAKKGICFDYAALMAGMLRSQGVPCKLDVGYAGTVYHAWISVWSEEEGWINGAIFFDGTSWQRMDPTFASTSKSSKAILKYIGDGSNYDTRYVY